MVADILFFQKRDRAAITEPDWVQLKTTPEGYTVNSYFADHPEMVLGDFTTESTQYGKQEVTVKAKEGADLAEQLKDVYKRQIQALQVLTGSNILWHLADFTRRE